MILTLKPRGKGNWHTITMQVDGARVSPLLVRVGQFLMLGGLELRIVRVAP